MGDQSRSLATEVKVCVFLLLVVVIAWIGFVRFLIQNSGERAAFWFMRDHLTLGESPEFVLEVAGEGLPQTLGSIVTWSAFQVSMVFLIVLIAGLTWLAYRLSRGSSR